MELLEFFAEYPKVALAFSGGTDSAYLLYAALKSGANVQPYYVKTAFQPRFEWKDARRLCRQLGVELSVVERDIFRCAQVVKNSSDRCYHCKKEMFSAMKARAALEGFPVLIDGTNASDDAGDRPGMRAIRELQVRSPLRECGITKAQVRKLSKEAGLFTWKKPAYACLATRIPTGTALTQEALKKVEAAEERLFQIGFSDFRVRVFHGAARLQFPEDQLSEAFRRREEIKSVLAPYYSQVLLDLETR